MLALAYFVFEPQIHKIRHKTGKPKRLAKSHAWPSTSSIGTAFGRTHVCVAVVVSACAAGAAVAFDVADVAGVASAVAVGVAAVIAVAIVVTV